LAWLRRHQNHRCRLLEKILVAAFLQVNQPNIVCKAEAPVEMENEISLPLQETIFQAELSPQFSFEMAALVSRPETREIFGSR
jgi:hypothetical protein